MNNMASRGVTTGVSAWAVPRSRSAAKGGVMGFREAVRAAASALQSRVLGTSRGLRCMEVWGGSAAITESISTPGLDAWVFSEPFHGDALGGDVYYMSLCGGGKITRIAVADVAGHGLKVADFSTRLRHLMRKYINKIDQSQFAGDLNHNFALFSKTETFATAILATYLANARTIRVCNAGHPAPLWYQARTKAWRLLTEQQVDRSPAAENLPLGLDDSLAFRDFAATLERDDRIVIYTDALIEASDAAGRQLGEAGLLEVVRALDSSRLGPAELGLAILQSVSAWSDPEPPGDDATLLILHHNASGPRGPRLAEKFAVYGKVFGLIK
jgi:sigma-B regulation protein RsbU (phosphoserine phosphatase)